MVSGKVTPSQSHGGALYYLVQIPREEYEKSLRLSESNRESQQVLHYSLSTNAIPTKPRYWIFVNEPQTQTNQGRI